MVRLGNWLINLFLLVVTVGIILCIYLTSPFANVVKISGERSELVNNKTSVVYTEQDKSRVVKGGISLPSKVCNYLEINGYTLSNDSSTNDVIDKTYTLEEYIVRVTYNKSTEELMLYDNKNFKIYDNIPYILGD